MSYINDIIMKYDMLHIGITKGILTYFSYRTWKRYFFNS